MTEARYYLEEALGCVFHALDAGIKNQLVVQATGTGKTKLGIAVSKKFKSILWLTHNIELIEQSSAAILNEILEDDVDLAIDENGGIISILRNKHPNEFCHQIQSVLGVIKEDLLIIDKRYTVASVQTIWRRLDQIPPDTFDLIIVDEAHHAGAETWTRTLNHFTPKLRLGLTATPWRGIDDVSLDFLFEKIVYEYPIEKGIKDGYLAKPTAIKVKTSTNLDKVHKVGNDFNQKELSEKVNTPERNNLIVSKYLEYGRSMPFIAFCCNVEHTQDLHRTFEERGVKVHFLVGDKTLTPDRRKVIMDFKTQDYINGDGEGLINCMIATEGFDFADIGCLIDAAPTTSKTRFYQKIGRGIRKKSEAFKAKFGDGCLILDIVDGTSRHVVVNCFTEDAQRSLEDKIFISDTDRQLLRDAALKREQKIAASNRQEDEIVELFNVPGFSIAFGNESFQPIGEMQKMWLRANGFDLNNSYTMHQFHQLFFASPAPVHEIIYLKENGYNVSETLSMGQVVAAKKEIEKRKN